MPWTSGSACRCTCRHSDPSRRKTQVTRSDRSWSGRPPTWPCCRSITTADSLLGTPFFSDSMIFVLRFIEYAPMLLTYPAQHHRNPLYDAVAAGKRAGGLTEQAEENQDPAPEVGWRYLLTLCTLGLHPPPCVIVV